MPKSHVEFYDFFDDILPELHLLIDAYKPTRTLPHAEVLQNLIDHFYNNSPNNRTPFYQRDGGETSYVFWFLTYFVNQLKQQYKNE